MLFKIKVEHESTPTKSCPGKHKNGSIISVDTETGEIRFDKKPFSETKLLIMSSGFGNTTCPCHAILRRFIFNEDLQAVAVNAGSRPHHETLFRQLKRLFSSFGYRKSAKYVTRFKALVPLYKKLHEDSMSVSSIGYMAWCIFKTLGFSASENSNNTLCIRNNLSQTQANLTIGTTADEKYPYRIACDRLSRSSVVRSHAMLIPALTDAIGFEEWAVFIMRTCMALAINELCSHHAERYEARGYRLYQAKLSASSTDCTTSIEMKPDSPASSISFSIDGLNTIEALFVTRKLNQLVRKLRCQNKQ